MNRSRSMSAVRTMWLFRVSCLLCVFGMPVLGCRSRSTAPAAARTLRDGLGRTVSLPPSVRRVVSLAPSSTEILYAVGAGPLVVGVDRYSDFPAAVANVEKVGSNLEPSMERVLALRPDLVFTATSANAQRTAEAIERAGIPVYVSNAQRLDQIVADVGAVADAVGRREAGEKLVASLAGRIAAARNRVANEPLVSTLMVVWPDPLVVAGADTHVDDLLRAAGGKNAAADVTGYPTYSIERVLVSAPAVIVVGSHADPAAAKAPPSLARLGTLPAVRDGRVYSVDGDLLFRPGPRVVDGIERLAGLLHPTRVPPSLPPAGTAP